MTSPITMFQGLIPPTMTEPTRAGKADNNAEAAQQFEALFVSMLLKEVRRASPSEGFFGGPEMDMYMDMLDQEIAQRIAEDGALGLAEQIEAQLDGTAIPTSGALPAPSVDRSWPVDGVRTSGFGDRTDPIDQATRHHGGLDIAAPAGTPIRAAASGTITFTGESGGYGNLVVVHHDDGVETRYAHAQDIHVREGQRVSAGETLGTVGATGRSTGPHLHFEVKVDGQRVDPEQWLQLGAVTR